MSNGQSEQSMIASRYPTTGNRIVYSSIQSHYWRKRRKRRIGMRMRLKTYLCSLMHHAPSILIIIILGLQQQQQSPHYIHAFVLHSNIARKSGQQNSNSKCYCHHHRHSTQIECWSFSSLPSISKPIRKLTATQLYDSEVTSDHQATQTGQQEQDLFKANGKTASLSSSSSISRTPNAVTKLNGASSNTNHSAGTTATFSSLSGTKHDHDVVDGISVNVVDYNEIDDVPRPTANGGYTHTTASRAKISAANKGRTPWNKGKMRSEEVKARISAGVRAKNRETFLKKLADMGLTEEEYTAIKKEERRRKEAERRARKTAAGGFRPTEETKAKISRILKEKYSKGEITRTRTDPSKVRRGFTHSEETRRKISESLKKRWQDDDDYRQKMHESYKKVNSRDEIRKKISESLKKKWDDPEFRKEMTDKIQRQRIRNNPEYRSPSYRQKISEAMKKKWKDKEYRNKQLSSIRQAAKVATGSSSSSSSRTGVLKTKMQLKEKAASSSGKVIDDDGYVKGEVVLIQPVKPLSAAERARRKTDNEMATTDDDDEIIIAQSTPISRPNSRTKPKGSIPTTTRSSSSPPFASSTTTTSSNSTTRNSSTTDKKTKRKAKKKRSAKEKDGSVSRLREERRDLFDLLYGDEDSLHLDDDDDHDDNDDYDDYRDSSSKLSKMGIIFGDEDLDAFDPYGLDDY